MTKTAYHSTSRVGRWWEGTGGRIISSVLIVALVAAALLLPPISILQRVADAGTTRITEAGGTIADPDGTQVTFLPGTIKQPFRAKVSSVPRVTFLEGSAGPELLAAAKAIPTHLVAKSPFYQLTLRGQPPTQSIWLLPIPNDSEPYETLDVYTWDSVAQSWQWLPHSIIREDDQIEIRVNAVPGSVMVMQTNPMPAVAAADLALAGNLPAEAQGALAQVHPTGLYLGGNGALDGALDAGFDRLGNTIVPVIRNYDGPIVRSDLLANMLVDTRQRDTHINALVSLVVGNLYGGVDIDCHGLDPNLRVEFNQFVALLADQLHAQGKELGVRVERPTQVAEDRWDTGAYDWVTLGRLADSLKVPAPVDPTAYIPGGQLEVLLNYAVGQVDRYKLEVLFSGRSIEQSGSYFLLKSYDDALQPLLGRIQADPTVVQPGQPLNLALVSTRPNSGLVYDPNIGNYVYRYQDDQGNARTIWLENAASLSHKIELLDRFNIRGFTVENLPGDGKDPDLWRLVRDFQQGRAAPIESQFTVQWTVRTGSGQLLSQVRPLSEPNWALAAPLEPGDLQVEAAVVDRGQVLRTESASGIAVATYTPTPTPTPAFTATPTPSPTPNVAELVVTAATMNVRSGPGTAYPQIGTLRQGATYRITGKNDQGDWWQISYDGKEGWVSGGLVRVTGDTGVVQVAQVAPPPTPKPQPRSAGGGGGGGAPSPAGGGFFAYGIQIDPYGNRASSLPTARSLGFTWIKIQVPWKDFEGSKGNRGFPDDVVNDIRANGMNVLASIVKAPNWARNPAYGYAEEGPPQNPQDYADYVGAFAGHFCGRVQAIEVWNEQNLPREWGHEPLDAGRYVQLLAAAYRAIKAACPSIIVVSGAPTPTGAPPPYAIPDFAYLEQMYQAGLRNYCDAVGVHPSGYGNPPDMRVEDAQAGRYSRPSHFDHPSFYFRNVMEQYRNIMIKYGDSNKRLWPTEFGWASTSSPVATYEYASYNSEQQQGEYIVRAYQMMKDWRFVGVAFLWNLDYNVTEPGSELAAFGIMGRSAQGIIQGQLR
jgi:hypothetical protein